jgi:hypothetical protein
LLTREKSCRLVATASTQSSPPPSVVRRGGGLR